jgi:hypothetical protein
MEVEPVSSPSKNGLTHIPLFDIGTNFWHTLLYPSALPGTAAQIFSLSCKQRLESGLMKLITDIDIS